MAKNDGIYGMQERELMCSSAKKYRDFYNIVPNTPIIQKDFGYYSLERWQNEGYVPTENPYEFIAQKFGFDESGKFELGGLGWCEAAFEPLFDEKVLEDRGEYELIQDFAGRGLIVFKGRRNGFMPEYVDHPVKDMRSWVELCKWRMNPACPDRYKGFDEYMARAIDAAKQGKIITQQVVGGYMYLRSLMGPVELLYKFYDEPELIHDCMQTWLELADSVISKYQRHVTLDELFIAEDICYNGGSLISPDMIREFLFPYYKKLIDNIKGRQLDPDRHLFFQVDTDGRAEDVIDLYMEIGMDVMSPFEVASGSDVVAIGQKYPNLVISGGIDKRVISKGKGAIDKHIDSILPAMKARGGYIPTCDHGVPEEVSFENYTYFRKRLSEF